MQGMKGRTSRTTCERARVHSNNVLRRLLINDCGQVEINSYCDLKHLAPANVDRPSNRYPSAPSLCKAHA